MIFLNVATSVSTQNTQHNEKINEISSHNEGYICIPFGSVCNFCNCISSSLILFTGSALTGGATKLKIMGTGKSFKITSVARQDLRKAGFDTSKVDDATMERLASKMADAYCDKSFWTDLEIIAEALEIPAKAKK